MPEEAEEHRPWIQPPVMLSGVFALFVLPVLVVSAALVSMGDDPGMAGEMMDGGAAADWWLVKAEERELAERAVSEMVLPLRVEGAGNGAEFVLGQRRFGSVEELTGFLKTADVDGFAVDLRVGAELSPGLGVALRAGLDEAGVDVLTFRGFDDSGDAGVAKEGVGQAGSKEVDAEGVRAEVKEGAGYEAMGMPRAEVGALMGGWPEVRVETVAPSVQAAEVDADQELREALFGN